MAFIIELGRLMARYCVAFESMKRFLSFKGKETLADLVSVVMIKIGWLDEFPLSRPGEFCVSV